MNERVKKIADAVLYEGWILYPYRAAAVKNRRRFNFGVLVPPAYAAAQNGTEKSRLRAGMPVAGAAPEIAVTVRFLQLCERRVEIYDEASGTFRAAAALEVDGRRIEPWEEAVERAVKASASREKSRARSEFTYAPEEEFEPVRDAGGRLAGRIVRRRARLAGAVEIALEEIAPGELFRVSVAIANETGFAGDAGTPRAAALAHALVSAHALLAARGGAFVSLLEPPAEFAAAAAGCVNEGLFPVLVGENGARDAALAAPVILYDYPETAPESAGDLFDGAEIDELLTLRILTLTDAEKDAMRAVDARARELLERTESLSPEDLMRLHGAFRGRSG